MLGEVVTGHIDVGSRARFIIIALEYYKSSTFILNFKNEFNTVLNVCDMKLTPVHYFN